MQILNIVLLVLSVGLSIACLVLINIPNPMYTLVYPAKNVKIIPIEKYFYMFSATTILYFLLNCFGANHPYNTILYFILSVFVVLYYLNWYNSLLVKGKKDLNLLLLAIIGLAIGINFIFFFMFSMLTVVLSMTAVTIYVIYWIFRLNDLGYKHYLYFYIYIWLANACFFNFFQSSVSRFLHSGEIVLEYKLFASNNLYGFSEIYVVIQYILIFLMFLSILLLILDIKKRSPMYEKQYLEENKPKEICNEGVNTGNAI